MYFWSSVVVMGFQFIIIELSPRGVSGNPELFPLGCEGLGDPAHLILGLLHHGKVGLVLEPLGRHADHNLLQLVQSLLRQLLGIHERHRGLDLAEGLQNKLPSGLKGAVCGGNLLHILKYTACLPRTHKRSRPSKSGSKRVSPFQPCPLETFT